MLALCAGLAVATGGAVAAERPAIGEYALKAAFLLNFAKFVSWPTERFADDHSPIVIGVLGPNPFGTELEQVVRGRKVDGREIVVRYFDSVDGARAAHVLFVNTQGDRQVGDLRRILGASGVLTVGESGLFTTSGGIITFRPQGDRLGFEINVAAADRAGIRISAQLQNLATAVRRRP